VINNALAEGRLTAEEHSDRLDSIYSAKTQAELVPLLEDLPSAGTVSAPAPSQAGPPAKARRGGRIVAIFSGATRRGTWHAEPVMHVVAIFGGIELDFRQAVLPGQEVVLNATTVLGGIEITVPPEMRVIDNGFAVLGGREIAGDSAESADPNAPLLRIEGACVLGGMEVRRRPRKGSKRKGLSGGSARLSGGLDMNVLGQVRERRQEIHREIRERRHDIHQQIRDQRRAMRRPWTDDDDDDY
jgi:Domain of unknown function (DUF1707)/Cell wall-active antibiotics response 4TMS YvqF